MRVKRIFVLAGVVALMGLLWATPAAADSHQSITLDPTSVPAVEGDVTITVTGADWTEPVPFFITACPGAQGDPTVIADTVAALSMCPTITGAVQVVAWDAGSFTTEVTVPITQGDIDAGGLVILAGWLSATPPPYAAAAVLVIVDEEAAAAAEAAAAEAAAAEAAAAEAAAAEAAAAEAADAEAAAEADDEMPDTGAESNLLVVVGAAILAAGLLLAGAGRRVRTATR